LHRRNISQVVRIVIPIALWMAISVT
jgi:hypothetical protein